VQSQFAPRRLEAIHETVEIAADAQGFSQIFFLLLFFALLLFTSLNFFPHDATEVQLRAPVRLFFEWDPLVAVVNALASHALYRGLLWSLLILVPTLFLLAGSFAAGFAPWARCNTLWATCLRRRSAASNASRRIAINGGQTGKYVVLIAGLVAAFFWFGGYWVA